MNDRFIINSKTVRLLRAASDDTRSRVLLLLFKLEILDEIPDLRGEPEPVRLLFSTVYDEYSKAKRRSDINRAYHSKVLRQSDKTSDKTGEKGRGDGKEISPHTPYIEKGEEKLKEYLSSHPDILENIIYGPPQSDKTSDKTVVKTPHDNEWVDAAIESMFTEFWQLYPRKTAKSDAHKAFVSLFKKNKEENLFVRIKRALGAQVNSWDWMKDDGKFIPYPATWIRGRRWEDESLAQGQPQEVDDNEVKELARQLTM